MKRLQLFEAFGVELEYMIVDKDTLKIRPIADELIYSVAGDYVSDIERGPIAWSNELVNHVLELKTNGPANSLIDLPKLFTENIKEINKRLEPLNAMLLPTASHPFMDPFSETMLWPHENNEIYSLYNRIFDCRGHGWSNVQSTHINLPFKNDEEFGRLHAAIRVVLPIIPALSASSPILDGQITDFLDTRLEYYRKNQEKIPSICGGVIPERVFTEADYHAKIFQVIQNDIRPFDQDGILNKYFLNSRGAIARFDRGAVEIRIIDVQESPVSDMAILELVVAAIRKFSAPEYAYLRDWHEDRLRPLFLDTIRHGENSILTDPEYLDLFGLQTNCTAGECWQYFASSQTLHFKDQIDFILKNGTLSTRIKNHLPDGFTHEDLLNVYRKLADCLGSGAQFK